MENPYAKPVATLEKEGEDHRTAVFYQRNELRETAYKLAAIFLAVNAVVMLVAIVMAIRQRGGSAWWGLVPFLTTAFASCACYLNSRRYTDLESESLVMDGKILGNLFSVGICLMGVYLIAANIGGLAVESYLLVLRSETLGPGDRSDIMALFPRATQIGFGAYFILGSRSLASTLIRLNREKAGPSR